jgi:predicted AlkP superfamily phosphohydrolase/phosphomutase
MRVLVLGLDGADRDLVDRLLAEGRLPTLARLARDGAYGPLRSTIPAVTPTAWSSFLTGLNPAGHGIFNFSSNPNRGRSRVESAASRSGAPLWRLLGAGGVRSAFVTVPFTYPAEAFDGVVVSGYGGPERPQILPEAAARAIDERVPGLVTAHHPMKERWWEDFGRYAATLIAHVDQIGDACRACFELEPDLGVLAVDFMSTDFAGHLGYSRLDPSHPAHDPAASGDELVQVYQAVDRVCGELIDAARERYGEEPTAIVMSDHGMKPIYWTFHANEWLRRAGHLRYRRRSLQRSLRGPLRKLALADGRLARTTTWYGRMLDLVPFVPRPAEDRVFADVDFGRTLAYCFATGGQIYLGEATGARNDAAFTDRLARDFEAIPHPETGEPLFEVLRKRDIYHGAHLDRAPELVLIPRDERVHVESSRRDWPDVFMYHDTLDPEHFYGYSGHHGVTGIIAAAGPGIRPGRLPEGSEITQLAATVLRLHGLSSDGLEPPIEAVLAPADKAVSVAAEPTEGDADVYSADEEAGILERLRDLGYE